MAVQGGQIVGLYVDGTKIANIVSNSFSMSNSAIDTTTKDSPGWREQEYGLNEGSFSFEGKFEEASTFGFEDLYSYISNKNKATIVWKTTTVGHKQYTATCLLTNLTTDAPMWDAQTFSGEFSLDGAPTEGTVA